MYARSRFAQHNETCTLELSNSTALSRTNGERQRGRSGERVCETPHTQECHEEVWSRDQQLIAGAQQRGEGLPLLERVVHMANQEAHERELQFPEHPLVVCVRKRVDVPIQHRVGARRQCLRWEQPPRPTPPGF